jgi:hypothetical protein
MITAKKAAKKAHRARSPKRWLLVNREFMVVVLGGGRLRTLNLPGS